MIKTKNIVLLLLIIISCGCVDRESKSDVAKQEIDIEEEQKYDNHDYDGSYYFDYIAKNDADYSFYTSGYLVIDNEDCYTSNHILTSDGSAGKRSYNGTCRFENNTLKINISSKSGSNVSYDCSVKDNKDLSCVLVGGYDLSGNHEQKVDFIYTYSLDEWDNYSKYFGLYLPNNIRWNISSVELIEKYGAEKISSAPALSDDLTWTHPLYSGTFEDSEIKEYTYLLSNDRLIAYFIRFYNNNTKPYNLYKEVKNILVDKYGEPTSEEFNWLDDTYRDNEERWDEAMRYSHLSIKTVWNFDGYNLIVIWKYNDEMNVEYVLNGYENRI